MYRRCARSQRLSVLVLDLDQNRTLEQWFKRFPDVAGILTVEGRPMGVM